MPIQQCEETMSVMPETADLGDSIPVQAANKISAAQAHKSRGEYLGANAGGIG
jgi:hypothetical protein